LLNSVAAFAFGGALAGFRALPASLAVWPSAALKTASGGAAREGGDKVVEQRVHRTGTRFKGKRITLRGGIRDGALQAFQAGRERVQIGAPHFHPFRFDLGSMRCLASCIIFKLSGSCH
jgi:hypothetical protein